MWPRATASTCVPTHSSPSPWPGPTPGWRAPCSPPAGSTSACPAAQGRRASMAVLEAVELSIRFGGLQALLDVSLQVDEYEIVGLIGPNGAGKTTAFNCITGFYRPQTGRVRFKGNDVSDLGPHDRSALGMGRTFQQVGLVKSTTVLENLLTAQHSGIEYGALAGMIGSPLS